MSREKFDEGCNGCEPAMLDLATGKSLPADHPAMKAVMGIWKQLTRAEKEAWHEFT